jgi:hypothetical protein
MNKEAPNIIYMLATCADLMDDTLPDNAGEDSVSNLPLWRGEPLDRSLREATVHHSIDGSFSIRKGRWKLACCPGSGGWSYPHPRKDDCSDLPPMQLYNLDNDVRERANVLEEHPQIVENMLQILWKYVGEGRSTPGKPQQNDPEQGHSWKQLWWRPNE